MTIAQVIRPEMVFNNLEAKIDSALDSLVQQNADSNFILRYKI